jgi:hypothetical protein
LANRRQTTKGLDKDQVQDLSDAWHHARKIGLPLNVMVTIRPTDIDNLDSDARCRLWETIRNKLGVYARLKGFPFTAVWTRESNPDGTGEHIHILMHVPNRHRAHFDDTVHGWYPGPAETDVRPAHQRIRFTHNNRRMSAIGYLTKQMTSQAWYRRGLIRKPGGPILGRRGGSTQNLAWKAREAHWRSREPARIVTPPLDRSRVAA